LSTLWWLANREEGRTQTSTPFKLVEIKEDIDGWWMNRKGEGERIVRKVDRRRGSEEGKM
jgi:hypothetical protein